MPVVGGLDVRAPGGLPALSGDVLCVARSTCHFRPLEQIDTPNDMLVLLQPVGSRCVGAPQAASTPGMLGPWIWSDTSQTLAVPPISWGGTYEVCATSVTNSTGWWWIGVLVVRGPVGPFSARTECLARRACAIPIPALTP